MPPRHRRDSGDLKAGWQRWLWVGAAGAGLVGTALQPSFQVARAPDVQLIAASGFDLATVADDPTSAAQWLADAGFDLGGFSDFAGFDESSLAELIEEAMLSFPGAQPRPTPPTTAPGPAPTPPTTTPPSPGPTTPPNPAPPVTLVPTPTPTTAPAPTPTTAPAPTPTTAPAPTPTIPSSPSFDVAAERQLVDLINGERTSRGLEAVEVNVDIRSVARNWSQEMAAREAGCGSGGLGHNPSYAKQMPGGWKSVAENVACGPSVDVIHTGLMRSPDHRKNILTPGFTDIGVGVVVEGNSLWVTQNFARY